MCEADVANPVSPKSRTAGEKIDALVLRRSLPIFLLAAGTPLLLLSFTVSAQAEAPVTVQAFAALKAAYAFQPADMTQENTFSLPSENHPENIIQLEKMIVMETPAGRSLVESVDRQQAILKQARFDWETGGFYYRKIGKKFTIEGGVWSHGQALTLLTVSW
jgi:hypothetical protein